MRAGENHISTTVFEEIGRVQQGNVLLGELHNRYAVSSSAASMVLGRSMQRKDSEAGADSKSEGSTQRETSKRMNCCMLYVIGALFDAR